MKDLHRRDFRRNAAWLVLLAPLAIVGGACGHDIQSPLPKLDSQAVQPDLVCNAKPVSAEFSSVTVHGQAFTPMPSKTLEDKPQLILPTITLNETSAIGMPVTKPITIQDDPAKPAESRVHWVSEKEMRFDLKPEDAFATGVFSITITNPDGKSKTTVQKALAVLPPPIVSMLKPPAICDDQADQKVEIDGQNFLFFDDKGPEVTVGDKTYTAVADPASCTPVDGNFVEKDVKLCTTITITIPAGDFMVTEATKVKVTVTNPAPADCASSEEIELTIEPPPEVDAVVPSTVCEGGSQLTLTGKNFMQGATVSLSCGGGAGPMASGVNVNTDGTQIGATFGAGATAGETCDVIVQNPDGCQDRPLPHKQVTVVSGPIVFYADPPVVYNGINTRITVYATTITPPLKSITIVPTGMTMPVTNLMNPTIVSGHPNRAQAIVPINQAPGVYDLTVTDSSGCFATLPSAITITKDLTVTVKNVVPPFGYTQEDTAVTIFRDKAAAAPADKPFVITPRVFLNPTNPGPTDVAVEMTGVSFIDNDTATGVVPKGTPVHDYDVVLVNPDGSVGLLPSGYKEVANPPPVVLTATPSSIVAATGQKVTLAGNSFDAADVVTVSCKSGAMPNVTSTAPTCNGSSCTQNITIDGSVLASGDVCIVRVTNPDGSYGEYSAIGVTTPSLNLTNPVAGSDMNVGRRALVAAAGNATTAARFVYAIGGDDGAMTPTVFDTTEFAPVDLYGKIGQWTLQGTPMKSKRSLAGAVTVGRYIYVIGGGDGSGPVKTAERALILSPRETPVIQDVDLALDKTLGLDAGEWHYKVSAIFDANDTDNPNGESLPSDPFSIKLPAFMGKKIAITLVWSAPLDSLGQPLPGVAGYRIYRTVKANDPPGSEVLLATVTGAGTITFKDDGTATPGMTTPLPVGSTGEWAQLPSMSIARAGLGVAAGFDPDPAKAATFYVYALLGQTAANMATTSYEYLAVNIAPNGRQTVGAWKTGVSPSAQARWQIGAWLVDKTVIGSYAPDTWIFIGGGRDASGVNPAGAVEAGKISTGGDLGPLLSAQKDFPGGGYAGYGVCGANQQLFVFGGAGGAPSKTAQSASLELPAPKVANNSWNSQGISLTHGRYLMGSAVQSSFIFLLGGRTDEAAPANAASKTTEFVVW